MMKTTISEVNKYASDKRYNFFSRLGEGSFGTVLKARDSINNEIVAIKIIKGSRSLLSVFLRRTPSSVKDAKIEVDILKGLHHPNIVTLKRMYKFTEGLYSIVGLAMVMEFCENGNLQSYLDKTAQSGKRLDKALRLRWYKQLSIALKFIHDNGIIHRDIKPPNILLDSHNNIKIADVGLAKMVWDVKNQNNQLPKDSTYLQHMSTVAGTPAYMAPEVFKAQYSTLSDVFSLGLVFVMIAENPIQSVPLGKWKSNKDCVGAILYKYPQSRELMPTQILHPPLKRANRSEVKLFNDMLQHAFYQRPSMNNVVKRVEEISRSVQTKFTTASAESTIGIIIIIIGIIIIIIGVVLKLFF